MKYSTKSRYALRLMVDLTLHANGDYIALKDISERQNISVKYLEQIISILHKSGFVKSVRGNAGGYLLTAEPKDYTLGDILRSTEGSLTPVECTDANKFFCPRRTNCPTYPFWLEFSEVINNFLDSKTLQDIVDNYNGGKIPEYVI